MTQQTHAPQADDSVEEFVMPCAEALMAGTLALMTGHARCSCAQHRDMMAKKAASNLCILAQHPHISDGLRTVAQKLHEQWVEVIQADRLHAMAVSVPMRSSTSDHDAATRLAQINAEKHRANWHATPETIQ